MFSRGIRGAITVEQDNKEQLEKATVELYSKIVEANDVKTEDISHIIFTLTKDLKSAFPATSTINVSESSGMSDLVVKIHSSSLVTP